MKKFLFSLLLAVIAVGASAQKDSTNLIWFEIQKGGFFATEDGKDFIVYKQEGKTAKELFDMVCVNVGKIYQSPQNVMSTVEGKSVSIRAISQSCLYRKLLGMKDYYTVHYNLFFEFKDGRIKINAPVINSIYSSNHNEAYFSKIAKSYFTSKGEKKKSADEYRVTAELYFCKLLSDIVGKYEDKTKKDDW